MKIITIFCLLICYSTLDGQSFPTYEDHPIWQLNSYDFMGQGSIEVTVAESIDTCGKNWFPIEELFSGENESIQTIGYYYQEGEKVFYKKRLDCQATVYLMYDFSLQEGDNAYIGIPNTWYFDYPGLDSVAYQVDNVEYKTYQGQLRKVLHVSFNYSTAGNLPVRYQTTWIEGIGDLYHPFPSAVCLRNSHACEVTHGLSCLETTQGLVYASESSLCTVDPSIIFVNQANMETLIQDGQSWETAFSTLGSALEIADYGDSIWIAKGIYHPTSDTNRAISFTLKNGVKIFGGFEGIETDVMDRDWKQRQTILSGNIGDSSLVNDNSYHVLYGIGLDSTTILDGFIIEYGYGIHVSPNYAGSLVNGGGLLLDTNTGFEISTPQIRNCLFRDNQAQNGGAVYCNGNQERFASPQFFNCTFFKNRAEGQGGAILKKGQNPTGITLPFIDCTFEENWARTSGAGVGLIDVGGSITFHNCNFIRDTTIADSGGIYLGTYLPGVDLLIEDCYFESNEGLEGGALTFTYYGEENLITNRVRIISSTFIENSARVDRGGALLFSNLNTSTNITIENSYFAQNSCRWRGGALFSESLPSARSEIFISSSIFKDNFVRGFPGSGAIGIGGSQFNSDYKESHLKVFNSLFEGNGGVLTIAPGSFGIATARFLNCTFYKNGEFPFAKSLSEIVQQDSFYSEIKLANSLVWEPSIEFPDLFVNGSPDINTLYGYHFDYCLISSKGCDLPGGDLACGANNIFEKDPEFIDPSNGNFALHGCSPAINQGNNSLLSEFSIELDLDLRERIQESRVDIGAYEQPSSNLMIEDLDVTPPSCHDSKDGKVTALVPDSSDLKYSWQNASNSGEGNTNLTSGVYQFTVTDENNCKGNFIISIDAPDSIKANYHIVHPENNLNGALELNDISGGTPPYTYDWNIGDTTSSIVGLQAGSYEITITDSNGCSISYSFELKSITDTKESAVVNTITIHPNPVQLSNPLWLEYNLQKPGLYQINMTDIDGKRQRTKSLRLSHSGRLFLGDWLSQAGIYVFDIVHENKTIKSIKIIAY